jgi:hypothetical protein
VQCDVPTRDASTKIEESGNSHVNAQACGLQQAACRTRAATSPQKQERLERMMTGRASAGTRPGFQKENLRAWVGGCDWLRGGDVDVPGGPGALL